MRMRCNNPKCGTFPHAMFEFEDRTDCPKCGASGPPMIAPLIDVHYMVMSNMGPITGSEGRQYVACQPKREYLCRHPNERFAATGTPEAVTCPKCKRTKEFAEAAHTIESLLESLAPPPSVTVDLKAGGS